MEPPCTLNDVGSRGESKKWAPKEAASKTGEGLLE